jgi:HlyD family secretion protein
VAALLLAWAFAPRPVEVEVATAAVGRFEATIDEDGKTRVRDRYVISAPLAGALERVRLREGDPVEAGAVVATLTPVLSPLLDERKLREQRARVEVTQAVVQRVDARIERARIARQGFVSPNRLESDQLGAVAAQKELDTALQERRVALYEVEQARAALSAVSPGGSPGGAFPLRSPVPGRVLRVLQTSETVVALGTPLLEIGDTGQLEIVADLLTTDALKLPPAAPVIVERWGGPGTLQGRVRLVEPGAFTKVSALGVEEQRVRVLIELTSAAREWAALGDAYRVGVRIVALARDGALMVPVSAVFPVPAGDGGVGGMAAFVVRDGRARQVPVQLGGRNGRDAWVTQGLQAGDAVIVYPGSAVRDGLRVRVRQV